MGWKRICTYSVELFFLIHMVIDIEVIMYLHLLIPYAYLLLFILKRGKNKQNMSVPYLY